MEPAEYARMDAAEDSMWWYRALHRRLVRELAGVHGTVLDAGCGTGGLLARLRAERPDLRTIGIEWAEPASHRASADQSSSRATCAPILKTPPRGRLATASMTYTEIGRVLLSGPVNLLLPRINRST